MKLNGAATLPAAPSSLPRIGEFRLYGGSKTVAVAVPGSWRASQSSASACSMAEALAASSFTTSSSSS
jgi:hypothetical protein